MSGEHRGLLSGTVLKWIAMVTMTIDHIGAYLVTARTPYIVLRLIGRMAFPIYCMLLIEGHHYSHDRIGYGRRLAIFALISEIPYNLVHSGTLYYSRGQNVFFTLCLGECLLILTDWLRENVTDTELQCIATLLCVIGSMALSEKAGFDYGMGGIMLIFVLHMLHPWNWPQIFGVTILMAVCWHDNWIQTMAVLVFPLVYALYNGTRGRTGRFLKYMFYAYYPIHLLILAWIRFGIH